MPLNFDRLVKRLTSLYGAAADELRDILGSADASDFLLGRSERLFAQIEALIRHLKVETRAWAESALQDAYVEAASERIAPGQRVTFDAVDVASIQVIAEQMMADMVRALDGIPREIRHVLRRTKQEAIDDVRLMAELAKGRAIGETRLDLTRRITRTLQDGATERLRRRLPRDVAERVRAMAEGRIVAIIDKNGQLRRYDLDYYSELVARTWTVAAANESRLRLAERAGTDLVQWSVHSGVPDEGCLSRQGKVYSISGQSDDFPALSDADRPPIHPHCRHVLLPVMADTLVERGQYAALSAFSLSDRAVENIREYQGVLRR